MNVEDGIMDVRTEVAKLLASDGGEHQYFGDSVAVSQNGKVVVVGVGSHDRDNDNDTMSLYIHTHDDYKWTQEVKVITNDDGGFDDFVVSIDVSFDGNTIVVGVGSDNNEIGIHAGAVYVYSRDASGWNQQYKLIVSG